MNIDYRVIGRSLKQLPKISIITPSFNQGRFVERTILSVLEQNYSNLEYIVVDGGSSDETLYILSKYGDKLTWISERDEGQSDAINKGIRMSTGDILGYLNTDDTYEKGALSEVAGKFLENPSAMWLTGKCRIIDENDREVRDFITVYKNFLLKRYSFNLLLVTNPISQPATFWRRDVVDEFGTFNVNEHLVMDYDYWLRIGKKYHPLIIDSYLASFRVQRTQKTSSARGKTLQEECSVARKYSGSQLINVLHRIHAGLVGVVYLIMELFAFIRVMGNQENG